MKAKYEKAVKIMAKYVNESTQIRKCNGNKELIDIINKINERSKNTEPLTVREFCKKLIVDRLAKIAKALPDDGYRMGGKVVVKCGKFTGVCDTRKDYANSCKYSATHGYVELIITPAELRCISVVGGLVTYTYPNQRNKVKKCYWYAGKGSKYHFSLYKVEGFIYAGYHALTKEAAKAGGERVKAYEKEKKHLVSDVSKALRLRYSYVDSLKVNCEAGTKAFILRCSLDITKKYRGSYLLKIAKEKSAYSVPYVERMIRAKVAR